MGFLYLNFSTSGVILSENEKVYDDSGESFTRFLLPLIVHRGKGIRGK